MIAHAMADMTNTICGHDRDVLILALSWARDVWANDDTSLRELATMPWRAKNPARYAVIAAIIDPAKLAEMLAARGRELGLAFWHGPNEPREPSPTDYVLYVIDGVIRLYSPLSPKTWQRHYTIVQARTILLQWLQLPDGAREEAERVLHGNHADPDELINTIPLYERVEPRRFDPDPDRDE